MAAALDHVQSGDGPGASPIVVTLIHGTFARDAAWTQRGSAFCKLLAERLAGAVLFEQFHWSGRNRLNDRQQAADELATFLAEQRRRHHDLPQIVVGHSHGGSVIAYLLTRYPALGARIAGAVFLATPFVDAKVRHDYLLISTITRLAFLFCAAALVSVIFIAGVAFFRERWIGVALLLGFVVGYLALALLSILTVDRSGRMTSVKLREVADSLSTCRLPTGRYFFMKTSGDEVGSALGTAQFASWLFSNLISNVARPLSVFNHKNELAAQYAALMAALLAPWGGIIPALVYVGKYEEAPGPVSFTWWISEIVSAVTFFFEPWWLGVIVLTGVGVALVALLFSALWVVCCLICWFAHLSFGRASFKAAMYLNLAVEAVPVGAHVLVHTSWSGVSRHDRYHSLPYQSEEAIRMLSDWMDVVLRDHRRSASDSALQR